MSGKQRRKRNCKFGLGCRNINESSHRQKFMHPCRLGKECTNQKDEIHTDEYTHYEGGERGRGGGGRGRRGRGRGRGGKRGGWDNGGSKSEKIPLGSSKETLEIRKHFYVGVFGPLINEIGTKRVDEVVPEKYVKNRIHRDGDHHQHITLIIKPEMMKAYKFCKEKKGENPLFAELLKKYTNPRQSLNFFLELAGKTLKEDWKGVGIGEVKAGDDDVFFVVVDWPSAQEFRKSVGLEEKDFHITIGFSKKDLHNVNKGPKAVVLEF